ncbi:MAG: hemerythrin family protein [Rhodospirillales bacterium]|nr:hemerythrin family protein [Rhodospirillales bacterium]
MKAYSLPEGSLYRITQLDKQHQELIDIVQSLHGLSESNELPEIVRIFESFLNKLAIHFTDEERMMKDTAYPDAESHRAHHQDMLKDAQSTFNIVKDKGKLLERNAIDSIDKLIRHMLLSDGPFVTHLKNR